MPIFYRDIGETINKTTFELRVPDDYETTIPGYYQKFPERQPIYQGATDLAFTYLPCARIIDMCNSDIPFTIVHASDVIVICGLISQYIKALKSVTPANAPENSKQMIWIRRSTVALRILEEHGQMATSAIKRESTYKEPTTIAHLFSQLSKLL